MSGRSKSNIAKKVAYERKQNKDGSNNPKYVDLLDVDKPIAGQNFGCFSFITPEKILKQKERFLFEEFLKKGKCLNQWKNSINSLILCPSNIN